MLRRSLMFTSVREEEAKEKGLQPALKNLTGSWDTALEKSEFEKNLLIFNYLLQMQKCSTTVSINSSKGSKRLACMNKEQLTNVRLGK